MPEPGIEPEPPRWRRSILPLDHSSWFDGTYNEKQEEVGRLSMFLRNCNKVYTEWSMMKYNESPVKTVLSSKRQKEEATPVRFELTRGDPSSFQNYRLKPLGQSVLSINFALLTCLWAHKRIL